MRFVTEITKHNISYCKEIMENVELRHLDGVKGNFGVSDTEYIAISTSDIGLGESATIPHAVYSNVIEDIHSSNMYSKSCGIRQRQLNKESGKLKKDTS